MSDAVSRIASGPADPAAPRATAVSPWNIFLNFLIIGATSFGGVVPYLRDALVAKRHWLDDKEFVEMLSISQSLPGLNATNMAILAGQKLRGLAGSVAAVLGMCLPGAALMYAVGIFYRLHGDHAWSTAALKGVAAAAVGLILSTVLQLSKKSLAGKFDFVFMALTVLAVNRMHISVPRTLIAVGIISILFHHPRRAEKASAPR
jgi:chromate transporter